MKKTLFIILLCALLAALFACGRKNAGMSETDVMQAVTTPDTVVSTKPSAAPTAAASPVVEATQKKSGEAPTVSSSLVAEALKTYTGWAALPPMTLEVADPTNSRSLATLEIPFSFGVARDGAPHRTTLSNQDYFDSTGYRAVCLDRKSAEKALYLTFDCGYENGYTSKVLDTLKEKQVPAAFFCTLHHIKSEPQLIARMMKEGHIVGNHSNTHPNFSRISRTQMAQEILDCDTYLRLNFGYTSPFFRFPEGCYSENALELVNSLGYTSVFWSVAYVDWDTSTVRGADYALETVTARLHPGAIILLHSVSPDNAEALGDIIDTARAQGYEFKALGDLPL